MDNSFKDPGFHPFLQIHPSDNVLVALQDLIKGEEIAYAGKLFNLSTYVKSKHKFVLHPLRENQEIYMYGVLVGKAKQAIALGEALTVENVYHASSPFVLGKRKSEWNKPDISFLANKTFIGYHRSDGSVGTANYWLVIPLVFCVLFYGKGEFHYNL